MLNEPVVIAEIGCNHKGDMDVACEMIKVAAQFCKVDVVSSKSVTTENCLRLRNIMPLILILYTHMVLPMSTGTSLNSISISISNLKRGVMNGVWYTAVLCGIRHLPRR